MEEKYQITANFHETTTNEKITNFNFAFCSNKVEKNFTPIGGNLYKSSKNVTMILAYLHIDEIRLFSYGWFLDDKLVFEFYVEFVNF